MQAYTQTPPVGLRLHAPQQTSCSMVPSPTAQAQYYIAQQRMSYQQNSQQSHGLWNGQSSSQPVSSSSNLQSRQMPQTWFTDSQNQLLLRNSASMSTNLPNGQFAPLPAAQHGTPMPNLSHHPQTLNRNTVPQQNYNLHNVSSTTSVSWFPSVYSNASSAIEQNNLMHQSVLPQYQSLNGHHNRMQIAHQPAAPLQQTDLSVQILSNQAPQKIHNNQGQIRGGKGNGVLYSTVNHFPATSQRLITPSQPSNYSYQNGQSHSSYNGNQVQHSSQIQHQPSPYRTENNSASYSHLKHSGNKHQSLMSNLPHPPSYTSQHFVNQSQPNQRINQSSALSLPQGNVQPQTPLQQHNTLPVSVHHSKTCHPTVPAIQGNTQPQVLQLSNTITGLPMSSQVTISSSTPNSEAPPPTYTESTLNYSQVTLMDLLVEKDNTQLPAQRHGSSPLSCLKTSFTTHGQTPSHITTKASYSQTPEAAPYSSAPATLCSKELQRVSEYQTPVKITAILKENEDALGNQLKAPDVQSCEGMQSRRFHTNSNTERKDGYKSNNRHGEVQYSEDVTESLELVMALQKVFQQSHKAVAVVPPISQQVPSPEKNDHVTTSSDGSLPFKIDAVWTLVKESKNVEQESNAMSLPKETIEELLQLFSVPHPETQERNNPEDGSTVESLIPDNQSTDIPQSKTGTTTSQGPVHSSVLTSKCPEDHNKVKTGKSNGNIFDLSKVQVLNFTLERFHYWVKLLESKPERRVKEPVADVEKCLLDLYWDGNTKNIAKQIHAFTAELSDLYSKVSIKEMKTAIFQYLQPKDLKMLAHGCHILKNETNLPTEEFRSSWLNIDGQPADIENILVEPILDFNLTDCALHRGFNTLNIYSESEPSTEVISATIDCQNDKMINKEFANSRICERKSTDKVNTQEASKKQEDENLEKHQQQNVNMNPEESVDSNEIADTLMESKSKIECEQVCSDASDVIASSSEIVGQGDLSNDVDSSSDSQLIELSLLSSDDARTLFKEYSGCDLQKDPSQLCQDKTKVSATRDNESNDFCNSANQIKFTCPHVTDIDLDGEHFCPRCWEETPLLDLDLEEALFSPKEGSPNMSTSLKQGHHNQSCTPQSGKPDSNCTVLSESSNIADSPAPKVDVFDVTILEPDPNPSDTVQSCCSLSGKSPVKEPHAPVCTESLSFTMPIEEQVCETNSSMGPELPKALSYAQNIENLVVPEQTKTPIDDVSPPKSTPCKKLKLTTTTEIPAEDDRFTANIVTKKTSATKPHSCDLSVSPADDGQNCKDEGKDRGEERKSPIKLKIQINVQCPQSGKPDPNVNVCSESRSDSSNSSTYGVNMTITEPDPNLGDAVQSSSLPTGKSPDKVAHGRVCSESVRVVMPIEAQVCEASSLLGVELPKAPSLTQNIEKRKPVIQSQTKTSREKDSPLRYPPCKKVQVTKTTSIPAEDDLFTPDIVVKKASSPNQHPSGLNGTPTEDGQHCKDERKERGENRKSPIMLKIQHNQHCSQTETDAHGKWKKPSVKSQVPNVKPNPERPAVMVNSDTNKEKVLGKTKQTGQNKGMEKMGFALYGFNSSNRNRIVQHQCDSRAKSCAAPIYITISNRPDRSNSYTDTQSAKQKVYSQWSSTFVETKKNTSSHKKHQKPVKVELKSRTQALQRLIKDRLVIKEKQFTDGTKRKQRAEHFVVAQKAKKLKCTIADENL